MKLNIVLLILLMSMVVESSFAQKLFPTPNQNVKDAYSLASSLYASNKRKLNFENNIKAIANISSSIRDPEQLVREYKSKMEQLEYEADQRKKQKMRELDKQIALIEKAMNEALRAADRNANSPLLQLAVAGVKAAAKAKARKKIDAAKRQAEADLDKEMKSAMGKIYNQIVKENKKSQKEYLAAAAQVYSEREESKYIEYYHFHDCVLKSMKKNYSYKNANWIKPNCTTPSKIYGGYQSTPKLEYNRYGGGQSASNNIDLSALSTNGQLAAIDKKLKESIKKVEDLIAKTDDAFKKVEYLELKQSLIDKAAEEKETIKKGNITTVQSNKPIQQSSQYQPLLDVAYRKLKLYQTTMPYKEFYESAKKYAEAELAENSSNGNGYIFLADLTEDVIEKYRLTAYALYLNRGDVTIEKKFKEAKNKFGGTLFAAISNQNNSIVSDAKNKGLLNGFEYNGKTPFEHAVSKDNAAVMEMLMPKGTDKYALLYFVIEAGGENIANNLLRTVDINKAPKMKGYDLLTASVHFNREGIAYNLLNNNFNYSSSLNLARYTNKALYLKLTSTLSKYAITKNNATMLDNILKKTPSILKPNASGENIVDEIVKRNKTALLPVLIKYGLDVKNPNYNYLLELAIKSNAEDIGISLIQQGTDINHSPESGGTLINLLAGKNGMNKLFDQLLSKGVSAAAFNNKDEFAIMTAMLSGEKEKTTKLIKKGSPLSFKSKLNGNQMHWIIENGIKPDFIRILAESNINVDDQDKNGDSPLMVAVKKKKGEYASALLQQGANVNLLNSKEVSPLQFTIYNKSVLYKDLIEYCKDPNVKGVNGWTALHFAAREGNLEAVNKLIAKNAKLTITDKWGRTAYRVAREHGHENVQKVLKKKMGLGAIIKSSYALNKKKGVS